MAEIETFHWRVKVSSPGTETQTILKAQFGDGYAQRAGVGINTTSGAWDISITAVKKTIDDIHEFLIDHGGWRAFLWAPRLGDPGLYVAEDEIRIMDHGNRVFTLSTTFRQTFKP